MYGDTESTLDNDRKSKDYLTWPTDSTQIIYSDSTKTGMDIQGEKGDEAYAGADGEVVTFAVNAKQSNKAIKVGTAVAINAEDFMQNFFPSTKFPGNINVKKNLNVTSNKKLNPIVFKVQVKLNALKYVGTDGKPLNANGVCDKDLLKALKDFKKINKTTNAKYDGIIDEKTWTKLFKGGKKYEATGKATTYSNQLVKYVETKEWFSSTVYNNGKTIGYGFDFYLYPQIKINYNSDGTISKPEAARLLTIMLDKTKDDINDFLKKKNLTVDQNTFDALTDLFYNRHSGPETQEIAVAMAEKDDNKVKSLFSDFASNYIIIGDEKMRSSKVLALIVLIFLVISMTSCNSKHDSNHDVNRNSKSYVKNKSELRTNNSSISVSILGKKTILINKDRMNDDIYGTGQLDSRWSLREIDDILNSIKGDWKMDKYIGFVDSSIYYYELYDHHDNIEQSVKNNLIKSYNEKVMNAKKIYQRYIFL